jgi:hypothetical protein
MMRPRAKDSDYRGITQNFDRGLSLLDRKCREVSIRRVIRPGREHQDETRETIGRFD